MSLAHIHKSHSKMEWERQDAMGPLFGKIFDLDGNGHVTPEEELFGYTMMKKMQEEQQNGFDANEMDNTESHGNWNTYNRDL